MAKIIVVMNQKGGVGKTTIACNLALSSVAEGYNTALIDMDTQGNAGAILSGNPAMSEQKEGGAQELYDSDKPGFAKTASGVEILHGHSWLEELDLRDDINSESLALRPKIRALSYDYVIFDAPPASGPRQTAPLLWADLVVIPVEPASLSMAGLRKVISTIQKARKVNPGMAYRLVVNRYVVSSTEQRRMVDELNEALPNLVMKEFRARVPVSDMLAQGSPVWDYKKDKALGKEWRDFCIDVLNIVK